MCSGVRRLRILAGHQQGAGAHVGGHTDCVQEGAGPEEVLRHVDDGVGDGVEHLEMGRSACMGCGEVHAHRPPCSSLKNASLLSSLPQSFTMQPQWHAMLR